jgi:F-type H+-transporting ATPase subunit epsilon
MNRSLHVVVRTPREVVAELEVQSLRVPTDTGQVGILPRTEATVTPVEPGLVLARTAERIRFIGTAGGLLRAEAFGAMLLTPVAVLGDDAAAVVAAVEAAVAGPDPERELRQAIERLETGLLREVRGGDGGERR